MTAPEPAGEPDNAPLFALLVPRLEQNEGFRGLAYQDTLGNWTIGFGRCDAGVKPGMTCTAAEAHAWLTSKLIELAAGLDAAIPWWRTLCLTRQSVLLEMAYNLGLGEAPQGAVKGSGLLGFSNMLANAKAGNFGQAAALMLMSLWARQVGERAMRLSILMEHGGAT